MRHLIIVLILAITVSPAGWAQGDRAQILSIMERGPVGIGQDFEAWARHFHPDWSVWFAGQDAPRARTGHMQAVRDYVASGAEVVDYEFDLVRLTLRGDTAFIDYNAIERIAQGDGSLRVVHYSGSDVLVREDGRWLIYSSSLSFPARYDQPQD